MSQIFKKFSRRNNIFLLKREFSTIEFPFKGYNTTWDKFEKIIQPSSLKPEVAQSLIQAHDYFKTLVSDKKINELSQITRPGLLTNLKQYYQLLDEYNIGLSLQVNQIAHTSIESLYCFNEYVGLNLKEQVNTDDYRFINMLGKKYFKKILVLPKKGFIKTLNSFLVIDILYRTEIMINMIQGNKKMEQRTSGFEKCLLQFVCEKKNQNKVFKSDGSDSPWKISNVNRWIEETNHQHFF